MVDGMTRDEVIGHLNNVKVKSNVNNTVYNFFTGLFGIEPHGKASGIGKVIYDRGAKFEDEILNGGIASAEDAANLLGHEAIHTLQPRAYGGLTGFARAYKDASLAAVARNEDEYFGNELEVAAYSFGPGNSKAERSLPNRYNRSKGGNYIFGNSAGWWR